MSVDSLTNALVGLPIAAGVIGLVAAGGFGELTVAKGILAVTTAGIGAIVITKAAEKMHELSKTKKSREFRTKS